jgi:hypothetical protein
VPSRNELGFFLAYSACSGVYQASNLTRARSFSCERVLRDQIDKPSHCHKWRCLVYRFAFLWLTLLPGLSLLHLRRRRLHPPLKIQDAPGATFLSAPRLTKLRRKKVRHSSRGVAFRLRIRFAEFAQPLATFVLRLRRAGTLEQGCHFHERL